MKVLMCLTLLAFVTTVFGQYLNGGYSGYRGYGGYRLRYGIGGIGLRNGGYSGSIGRYYGLINGYNIGRSIAYGYVPTIKTYSPYSYGLGLGGYRTGYLLCY